MNLPCFYFAIDTDPPWSSHANDAVTQLMGKYWWEGLNPLTSCGRGKTAGGGRVNKKTATGGGGGRGGGEGGTTTSSLAATNGVLFEVNAITAIGEGVVTTAAGEIMDYPRFGGGKGKGQDHG